MSYTNMLTDIIAKTFKKNFGKFQSQKCDSKVMVISFNVDLQPGEEGYRYEELAIYADYNYISVYRRALWTVISSDDLEWDEEEQDFYVKSGKDYVTGHSSWELIGSHSSCWTEYINDYLSENRHRINSFKNHISEEFFTSISKSEFFLRD